MAGPSADRVVVITGASSGIGRATALAFSRKAAKLVLCSRNEAALSASAAECRGHGAEVITCTADVADDCAVEKVRTAAVAAFGRIDVWVNCAAALYLGRFEDISPAAFRRVILTNVIGCANCSRTAVTQFAEQGDRGTLINLTSMLGVIGEPYVAPYVASKFAIRGMTACLRQEARNRPGIRICAVLPWAVDTPIYHKAGNVFGFRARSIFPVYSPERVAGAIVRAAEYPRREVIVGALAHLIKMAEKIAPMLVERLVGNFGPRLQFQKEACSRTDGNAFHQSGPYESSGGWQAYWKARLRRLLPF